MITSIVHFQDATSYERSTLKGHFLDWANQPNVYKHYPDLESLALPKDAQRPSGNLSTIIHRETLDPSPEAMTLEQVSLIFFLTQTLTARSRHPGGDFFYRSVPSAGALYPCEIYVVPHGSDGLEPGLYHYAINTHSLTRLRYGDLSSELDQCLAPVEKRVSVLTFFVTVILFRSAWKYRDRAYRYHLLDSGHLVENLSLALRALRLPVRVDEDFDDDKVNDLLCLDVQREVCTAVVRVLSRGPLPHSASPSASEITMDLRSASQVAGREIDYPTILEMHAFTAKGAENAVPDPNMVARLGLKLGPGTDVAAVETWPEVMSYSEAIWKRRSKRNFVSEELPEACLGALSRMLCEADRSYEGSVELHEGPVCVGLLARRVEGLQPGLYLLKRSTCMIHPVIHGPLTGKMARICLDQEWLSLAALHFLFMTNLDHLERNWGPRGYRYAMLAAGRLGQRVYVGATALGLGACGIGAFYDYEAAQLIGLAEKSRLLYLVAAGPVNSEGE